MVKRSNRNRYQTVTGREALAVLVPATPIDAEGEATFQMELGTQLVRRFTLTDRKVGPTKLKGAAERHFFALVALRDALELGDELMLPDAMKRLESVYRDRERQSSFQPAASTPERQRLGEYLASYVGLSPDESLKHWEGLRPGPKAKADPHRWFSYEVTKRVAFPNAQLALWRTNGRYRSAIYCNTLETALYVHTFIMAPTGGLGWRICPHCNVEFFQKQSNQDYCIPAHGDTHRVARSRHKKRQKERKKNGTHKAR